MAHARLFVATSEAARHALYNVYQLYSYRVHMNTNFRLLRQLNVSVIPTYRSYVQRGITRLSRRTSNGVHPSAMTKAAMAKIIAGSLRQNVKFAN